MKASARDGERIALDMGKTAHDTGTAAPGWLAGEMPPGYQNRLTEIERLTRDLETMGRFGRLLWHVGPALHDIVRDTFTAFSFDAHPIPGSDASFVAVTLDTRRRLLLHVSSARAPIQRKSEDVAQVFRLLHELAEEGDRVVLVANHAPDAPPAGRPDPIEAEALNLLRRLGANFLSAPTLFALWTLSLQAQDRARTYVERLHAQDGGVFLLPRSEAL